MLLYSFASIGYKGDTGDRGPRGLTGMSNKLYLMANLALVLMGIYS